MAVALVGYALFAIYFIVNWLKVMYFIRLGGVAGRPGIRSLCPRSRASASVGLQFFRNHCGWPAGSVAAENGADERTPGPPACEALPPQCGMEPKYKCETQRVAAFYATPFVSRGRPWIAR